MNKGLILLSTLSIFLLITEVSLAQMKITTIGEIESSWNETSQEWDSTSQNDSIRCVFMFENNIPMLGDDFTDLTYARYSKDSTYPEFKSLDVFLIELSDDGRVQYDLDDLLTLESYRVIIDEANNHISVEKAGEGRLLEYTIEKIDR